MTAVELKLLCMHRQHSDNVLKGDCMTQITYKSAGVLSNYRVTF